MCTTCGCDGNTPTFGDGKAKGHDHGHDPAHDHKPEHDHEPGHDHKPGHDHEHVHEHVGPDGTAIRHRHDHRHDDAPVGGGHAHDHDHDHGDLHVAGHHHHEHRLPHAADLEAGRALRIERDMQAKNNACAAANRVLFTASGCFVVNLMSSPGSGKTTLLVRTLGDLKGRFPVAVIEGDQQSSLDAERIRATGVPALQINTGKGCHLDAPMITRAIGGLKLAPQSALFIENVGNLICPAAFDLGETRRVVVLSVTEGDDKPLKYADIFAGADLLVINKIDLLPHVSFDVGRLLEYAHRIKPGLEVIELSATGGQGLERWYSWIESGLKAAHRGRGIHGH